MKTKKVFFRTKLPLLLLACFFLMTGMLSCKKEAGLDEVDITNYEWEVVSILTEGTTRVFSKDEVINKKIGYVLWFTNDSVFQLNFSANAGYGYYELFPENKIAIKSYTHYTRARMSEFDLTLMSEFPKMTSYEVIDNTLIFRGSGSEVEFQITDRSIKHPE
jgi:nucleoid-associated protein YejK